MRLFLSLCAILLFSLVSCDTQDSEVVIYCALDRIYSEPLLKRFEDSTGIHIKGVYDTELTKTVGLVNRLIAEASSPSCDVFWNNEISRTILLQRRGLLEPYRSPSGESIPKVYKDSLGYWHGFAARGRIIIYNKSRLGDHTLPNSILDLVKPEWQGKAALAYPLFGTTATHAAVLFSQFGDQWGRDFFSGIKENGIAILDGNATVRDRVVSGDYWWGFTDTDDANAAIVDGKDVGIIYPDQTEEQMGVLIIPNAVCLIKGARHKVNGQRLIDYILSPEVEKALAYARSAQIPLRQGISYPENVKPLHALKATDVDFALAAQAIEPTSKFLKEIFVK